MEDDPRSTPGDAPQLNRPGGRQDALAVKLPVLRATLERQLRFRREQLDQLDQCGQGLEPSFGAELPDGCAAGAALALREVDVLVVAGARERSPTSNWLWNGCVRGRYGRCGSCGTPIPLAVLEAIPKTKLCLTCQARRDQGDHQRTPRTSVPTTRPDLRRT